MSYALALRYSQSVSLKLLLDGYELTQTGGAIVFNQSLRGPWQTSGSNV